MPTRAPLASPLAVLALMRPPEVSRFFSSLSVCRRPNWSMMVTGLYSPCMHLSPLCSTCHAQLFLNGAELRPTLIMAPNNEQTRLTQLQMNARGPSAPMLPYVLSPSYVSAGSTPCTRSKVQDMTHSARHHRTPSSCMRSQEAPCVSCPPSSSHLLCDALVTLKGKLWTLFLILVTFWISSECRICQASADQPISIVFLQQTEQCCSALHLFPPSLSSPTTSCTFEGKQLSALPLAMAHSQMAV